ETWPAIPIGQLARANPSPWIAPTTSNTQPSRACTRCCEAPGTEEQSTRHRSAIPLQTGRGSQTRRREAPDFFQPNQGGVAGEKPDQKGQIGFACRNSTARASAGGDKLSRGDA